MGGINDFIMSKISVSKYMEKIKIHRHNKLEPMGISLYAFSTAQEVCSKLQNQAKCTLTVQILIASKDCYLWPSG